MRTLPLSEPSPSPFPDPSPFPEPSPFPPPVPFPEPLPEVSLLPSSPHDVSRHFSTVSISLEQPGQHSVTEVNNPSLYPSQKSPNSISAIQVMHFSIRQGYAPMASAIQGWFISISPPPSPSPSPSLEGISTS